MSLFRELLEENNPVENVFHRWYRNLKQSLNLLDPKVTCRQTESNMIGWFLLLSPPIRLSLCCLQVAELSVLILTVGVLVEQTLKTIIISCVSMALQFLRVTNATLITIKCNLDALLGCRGPLRNSFNTLQLTPSIHIAWLKGFLLTSKTAYVTDVIFLPTCWQLNEQRWCVDGCESWWTAWKRKSLSRKICPLTDPGSCLARGLFSSSVCCVKQVMTTSAWWAISRMVLTLLAISRNLGCTKSESDLQASPWMNFGVRPKGRDKPSYNRHEVPMTLPLILESISRHSTRFREVGCMDHMLNTNLQTIAPSLGGLV